MAKNENGIFYEARVVYSLVLVYRHCLGVSHDCMLSVIQFVNAVTLRFKHATPHSPSD